MSQEQHVLRCFSCETFQVQIVKKSNKWECKVCGAKQSIKQIYGKGSGKECRELVMKLNQIWIQNGMNQQFGSELPREMKCPETRKNKALKSKWIKYLEEYELGKNEESCEDEDLLNDNVPKRMRRTHDETLHSKYGRETSSQIFDASVESDQATINNENDEFKAENGKINNNDFISHLESFKEMKSASFNECLKKNNDSRGGVNKSTNIFASDPDDFDEITNISFK